MPGTPVATNIMDLARCHDFFFLEAGLKLKPRAWAVNTDGCKFVEHEGKRCLVVESVQYCKSGPIPILKSGKE